MRLFDFPAIRELFQKWFLKPRSLGAGIEVAAYSGFMKRILKTKQHAISIGLLCATALAAVTCGGQPVIRIAAGSGYSLFLGSDGSLWGMGHNNAGELGDGTWNNTNRPERIVTSGVTAIAAGGHTIFVRNDGSLWVMGGNIYGELGNGTWTHTNRPQQIVTNGVTAVAASDYNSLFLKSDGSLWGMGYNWLGELGNGTYSTNAQLGVNVPVQALASNVTAIASGQYFTFFLESDGSLWGMGMPSALADGSYATNGFGFDPYGTNVPEQIVASGVTAVAAGTGHSLFLKSDGSLWAMGYNHYGQLGDGTYNDTYNITNRPRQIVASGVTAIAAGGSHSLFLKSDGSLWAMGWNQYGQLGDGTYNATNRPEQIVAGGVTAIAAGTTHTVFLKSDGSLWGMGDNQFGQLGDGTYTSTNRPEQIHAGPPGYNRISVQILGGGSVSLSFVGIAGGKYALDRSFNLIPAEWVAVTTNQAGAGGAVVFSDVPSPGTNNFWRVRWVR
jgi:alpha-tubulin suppressor-like RCC1 family protein